jgi:protein-tyrosine-phosphatase
MKTRLFLCTGNFYRSRFAEIFFNWHAEQLEIPWRAYSRGLARNPLNPGKSMTWIVQDRKTLYLISNGKSWGCWSD